MPALDVQISVSALRSVGTLPSTCVLSQWTAPGANRARPRRAVANRAVLCQDPPGCPPGRRLGATRSHGPAVGISSRSSQEDTTTSQSRPGRAPATGAVPAGCAGCRGFGLFCAPIADGPVDCDGWAACEIILPGPAPDSTQTRRRDGRARGVDPRETAGHPSQQPIARFIRALRIDMHPHSTLCASSLPLDVPVI